MSFGIVAYGFVGQPFSKQLHSTLYNFWARIKIVIVVAVAKGWRNYKDFDKTQLKLILANSTSRHLITHSNSFPKNEDISVSIFSLTLICNNYITLRKTKIELNSARSLNCDY